MVYERDRGRYNGWDNVELVMLVALTSFLVKWSRLKFAEITKKVRIRRRGGKILYLSRTLYYLIELCNRIHREAVMFAVTKIHDGDFLMTFQAAIQQTHDVFREYAPNVMIKSSQKTLHGRLTD